MALSGDTKENYVALQESTGERFAHMADRMTQPKVLEGLDEAGVRSNEELATWLRKQKDNEEIIAMVDGKQEARDKAAEERAKTQEASKTPQNRTSTQGAQRNG